MYQQLTDILIEFINEEFIDKEFIDYSSEHLNIDDDM